MSLFYIRRLRPHKVQFQFFMALGHNVKWPSDRDLLIFIVNLTLVFTFFLIADLIAKEAPTWSTTL